jgi:3-oxoacyl-[acyl-carrier protein] reductase
MTREFSNKVALVTGGSRGIGRSISIALGQSDARVAVNYLSDAVAARSTLADIEKKGGTGDIFQADVSNESAVTKMIEEIESSLGPIDILVTNAGIGLLQDHQDITFESYRKIMATNVDGTFLPVMAVKDGMIERGTGNIVCISSVAGLRARSKLISYSISKSAVIGLVRSCAAAFGPAVRVNGIAPGLIQTDMTKASMDLPLQESIKQETFLKTIGVPENISDAVLFLLSSRANFISGQTLIVDGGRVTVP